MGVQVRVPKAVFCMPDNNAFTLDTLVIWTKLGTDFKCRRGIPEGFICALIALHQNMGWRNCLELPASHFTSERAFRT